MHGIICHSLYLSGQRPCGTPCYNGFKHTTGCTNSKHKHKTCPTNHKGYSIYSTNELHTRSHHQSGPWDKISSPKACHVKVCACVVVQYALTEYSMRMMSNNSNRGTGPVGWLRTGNSLGCSGARGMVLTNVSRSLSVVDACRTSFRVMNLPAPKV
jgi:hypothetical protein